MPLDPDTVARRAFNPASGVSGCGGKSAAAMILELQEVVGHPWPMLPLGIGSFANGGGPYGATCGGLAGPFFVMTLVGASGAIGTQYHKWYCDFAFPTIEWDDLFTFKGTIQSVADSPLCHESRSQWENVYLKEQYDGVNYDGTRCTKLPMDTVKKAVQMLNDWKAGAVLPAWAADKDYETCYTCHTQLNTDHKPGAIHSSQRENCNNCHTVTKRHAKSGPITRSR